MNEPSLHDLPDVEEDKAITDLVTSHFKPDAEEKIIEARGPADPFPVNEQNYRNKVNKVGPRPARKFALLDEIDNELQKIVDENAIPGGMNDDGPFPSEIILTETEAGMLGMIATLSQLLREEWTYK